MFLLLCDAMQSVVVPRYVVRSPVCPSVWLSVTFRYRDHIGWNTSKIVSRPDSLRSLLTLTTTWAIWSNGNTLKIIGRKAVGPGAQKRAISPKLQCAR